MAEGLVQWQPVWLCYDQEASSNSHIQGCLLLVSWPGAPCSWTDKKMSVSPTQKAKGFFAPKITFMSCAIGQKCGAVSETDKSLHENYILTGVAILILVTFLIINCTVKSTTATVLTLCVAVSLFMVWICMTALANSSAALRPIGSTAGSQLPMMANTMDTRVLVGTTPAPTRVVQQAKLTAQNCLVGAYNPEFVDINKATWEYNMIPVDGAVPGAGDPNGEEIARWAAASQAWRDKIGQDIRPDDNIVFDEDDDETCEDRRIGRPIQVYDFSTTAHGGYGQRMIQESAQSWSIPNKFEHGVYSPYGHAVPSGVITVDPHYSRSHSS